MNCTNFDRVADIYDETRVVPSEIVTSLREKIFNFLLKNKYEPPYQFLSIGIGTGRVESSFVSKQTQLFGIDISNLMLQQLKKKNTEIPLFLTIADGTSLPFRDSFHLVTAIHVVHLFKDYKKLISELENITQFVVIGDAFIDTYVHPLFQKYKSEVEKQGWTKVHVGLFSDELAEYLFSEGYSVKKEELAIPTTTSNYNIYNSIKKKLYSSQWKIPNKIHNRALKNLRKFIKKKENILEGEFLTNAYLLLFFIDCRKKS